MNSLPNELGGNFEVDHEAWLLRCSKSMANRFSDLCDISSPTLTKSDSQETPSELICFEEERTKTENGTTLITDHEANGLNEDIRHQLNEKQHELDFDKEAYDIKETSDSLESTADDTCEDDVNGESENFSSSFSQISQNNISLATDPSPTSSETFTDITGIDELFSSFKKINVFQKKSSVVI